jgi:hypothetical protein
MLYLSQNIMLHHNPKELQQQFHCGENPRLQKKNYCAQSSYCHCGLFQLDDFSAIGMN